MRTRLRGQARGRILRFLMTRQTPGDEPETVETSVREADFVQACAGFPEFGALVARIAFEAKARRRRSRK